MAMQVIECNSVHLWDGGELQKFAFYINKDVPKAEIEAKHPHCLVKAEVLVICSSLDDYAELEQHKLLISAWNKLSPLERKALDLKDPN